MAKDQAFSGALAIIKVNAVVVGLMRNVRINESFRRVPIRGLGSILPIEAPVTEWSGALSCSFWEIDYTKAGIAGAVKRDVGVGNAASTAGTTLQPSFEDNISLSPDGVTVEIFKKVTDAVDATTGLITPNAVPYATIGRCLIESDNVSVDEGNVSGRDQAFQYLDPVIFNAFK